MVFTVIISHDGDPINLWFTTTAIDLQMEELDVSYEYRIVSHGNTYAEVAPYIQQIKSASLLGSWQHFTERLGSDTARQRASVGAKGQILYFSEDHILIGPLYFKQALAHFNHVDALHTGLKQFTADTKNYHYVLNGLHNFVGIGESSVPLDPFKPYRIAIGNHGSFFVRRDVFEEVGGYGPEGLHPGYCGEEQYFDLKLALLDKTNWLDPVMTHYHYTERAGG